MTEHDHRTYGLVNTEKPGVVVFYVAFAFYVVYASVMSTMFGNHREMLVIGGIDPLNIAEWAIWGLLGVKLALQRYTPAQAAATAALGVTAVLSWKYSGLYMPVPDLMLFIAAGQGIKIRRLAQIALPLTVLMFAATLIGHFSGILENIQIKSDFSSDASGRNSLGFLHPNTFGRFVFQIVVSWLVLRYEKTDWLNAAVLAAASLATWLVTESETFTAAILLAGLAHVFSVRIRSRKLLAIAGLGISTAIIGFTLLALAAFNPESGFWSRANAIVANRLTLARWYIVSNPPTVFGQTFDHTRISWYPLADGQLLVDNAFGHIILRYGFAAATIIIGLALAVFVKAVRESEWNPALFGLLLYIVVGFAENAFYMFDANYFLIAATAVLYSRPLASLNLVPKPQQKRLRPFQIHYQ